MGSVGTSILEDLDPSPPPTPRDPDLHSQLRRASSGAMPTAFACSAIQSESAASVPAATDAHPGRDRATTALKAGPATPWNGRVRGMRASFRMRAVSAPLYPLEPEGGSSNAHVHDSRMQPAADPQQDRSTGSATTVLLRYGCKRFTQRVLRPLVATASCGSRDFEEPCCVDDGEPIPVDEANQLGEVAIESVDRISDLHP